MKPLALALLLGFVLLAPEAPAPEAPAPAALPPAAPSPAAVAITAVSYVAPTRPEPAAVAITAVSYVAPARPGPAAPAALAPWTGGINLYRPGVYSMQRTWIWCTAASVQMMRNIVYRRADHSTAGQRGFFSYMRAHNRYRIPVSDGVDPQGWVVGLRRYVDDRYRIVSSPTYEAAIRSAVTRLRQTNRPVGVIVARGGHAWVLTGFTATADPATTQGFTVTSVRVTGPLYGRQSRNGYDMRPNTRLSAAAFKRFLTPFHYGRTRMIWEGRYITIQAVPSR